MWTVYFAAKGVSPLILSATPQRGNTSVYGWFTRLELYKLTLEGASALTQWTELASQA